MAHNHLTAETDGHGSQSEPTSPVQTEAHVSWEEATQHAELAVFLKGVSPLFLFLWVLWTWVMVIVWNLTHDEDHRYDFRYYFISHLGNHDLTDWWPLMTIGYLAMAVFMYFYAANVSQLMSACGMGSPSKRHQRIQVTLVRLAGLGVAMVGVFSEDFDPIVFHTGGVFFFFLFEIGVLAYTWLPKVISALKQEYRGLCRECSLASEDGGTSSDSALGDCQSSPSGTTPSIPSIPSMGCEMETLDTMDVGTGQASLPVDLDGVYTPLESPCSVSQGGREGESERERVLRVLPEGEDGVCMYMMSQEDRGLRMKRLRLAMGTARVVQNAQVATLLWYLLVSVSVGQGAGCGLWLQCRQATVASAPVYEWALLFETVLQLGVVPWLIYETARPGMSKLDMDRERERESASELLVGEAQVTQSLEVTV
ncbi:hypothetical protein KIPB_001033 [Kipferlia bialata]|uniref:Uncharacterized protein n=1 Tax=Kipferlia bialata TaxID=797122 RepID=A0A9K3GFG8_9EUKA|nr:hypothetical protein KIPB_001033 [Kipferlia bialata]|eukprot:g1033.t1